jgi:hypothetical protein
MTPGGSSGKQDSPEGARWACRLEIYPVNPAEQPGPAKWETGLVFRLADQRPA